VTKKDVKSKIRGFNSSSSGLYPDPTLATHPSFMGFEITGLFEFFMIFVVLSGIASVILFGLTKTLQKMMHGV
jgi:POT family proton-dependent oligopeptide transporter